MGGSGREVEGEGVDIGEDGRAPAWRMEPAEAKKLKGVVMTASCEDAPGCDADVGGGEGEVEGVCAGAQPMPWGAAQARRGGGPRTARPGGPRMKRCEVQTWSRAA